MLFVCLGLIWGVTKNQNLGHVELGAYSMVLKTSKTTSRLEEIQSILDLNLNPTSRHQIVGEKNNANCRGDKEKERKKQGNKAYSVDMWI